MSINANKKIVFIGDSNTEGYGLKSTESYPALLAERFKEKATCYNLGVSGTCVITEKLEGLWVGMPYLNTHAYLQACALEGDIYVINLGTNDATDGASDNDEGSVDPYGNLMAFAHRFKSNYEQIIEGVTSANPAATIILCRPIPVGKSIWKKHKEIYLTSLLPYIDAIASERRLYTIDLHTPFLEKDALNTYYLEDGLHLNIAGAKAIADLIEPNLWAHL